VCGQVAGPVFLPDVGLVIGPPWLWEACLANIGQPTGTEDDIHNIDCLTADRFGNGEASVRDGRRGDNGGELGFLAHFAGTTRGFVEASGDSMVFGDRKGIVGKDRREIGKLPVCTDQRVSWEND
jgi:hypothetical protein